VRSKARDSSRPKVKANAHLAPPDSQIDLPERSLVDAQLSAEYVAHAVRYLAPQSSTGKIAIIGHSQGAGLNPQWALQFWPSIRPLVSNYIALAADFQGTVVGVLLCNPLKAPT
jgi:hypothetical protein